MPRESTITKMVEIKINTGNFTNITISNEYQEKIEWEDKKDRQQKEDAIMGLLLENLKKDVEKVLTFTGRQAEGTVMENSTSPKTKASSLGFDLGDGEPI